MSRILFLTTAHHDGDDRIFHHQAKSFLEAGFKVKISSLSSERNGVFDGIEIESYPILAKSSNEKIHTFQQIIRAYQPDAIICSEPLAVVACRRYKQETRAAVFYDITEWYPSKRMIAALSFPKKIIQTIRLSLIQLWAGMLSTAFIFGEKTKRFPLYHLFFWKKSIVVPYYPKINLVPDGFSPLSQKKITLAYTGILSEEKGVGRFLSVASELKKQHPDIELKALIIGKANTAEDEKWFNDIRKNHSQIHIETHTHLPLEQFCNALHAADVCLDLRSLSFENHYCLPIKIFYYAASAKPVVYSALRAIPKHVQIEKFGYLVDPDDAPKIAQIISGYIDTPTLYDTHARNARALHETQYNWEQLAGKLISFVENLIRK